MTTVIRVENLGKKYRIHHQQRERYTALRDVIANRAKSLFRNFQSSSPLPAPRFPLPAEEDFWALKDVSFEIKQGDVVGIIGRNGAGKSTLLKVLSRITEPTTGRVAIKGRIASLLEVGTGFHPELTGRENIYLNGTILGMKGEEIKRKFDAIVEFAEVEKFLDTPVKRYSSGMYVRLAFSLAAHLEPDILAIDEVLAVGDARFQKKCLGKLNEIGRQGMTVLFVSHNMQIVRANCEKGIMLDGGRIESIGSAEEVVSEYLQDTYNRSSSVSWRCDVKAPGNNIVRLCTFQVVNAKREVRNCFDITETVGLEMIYEVFEEGHILWFGYNLYNSNNVNVFDTHSTQSEWYEKPHPKGKFSSIAWIPGNLLNDGVLMAGCAIFNHERHELHFHERDVITFSIIEDQEHSPARGKSSGTFPGVIRPLLQWETERVE